MNKLMLIGSGTVHTFRFYRLVRELFSEVIPVTDQHPEGFEDIKPVAARFEIRNPLKAYQNIKHLERLIEQHQPDIIHVHQANSTSWLALKANKKFKKPLLVTSWGSDILVHPFRSHLIRRMVKEILQKADAFTADAQVVAEKMKFLAGNPQLNVTVVNLGIELFKCKGPKENIIYSNRLHQPNYRIDKVIDAFARFRERNSDWQLVIAGSGPGTERLKQYAQKRCPEGSVIFTGWLKTEENREWYCRSKIFISIPESDATAVSLLEAMWAGCIPVVSDTPAAKEWIRHGENGIVATLPDNDFLPEALQLDSEKVAETNRALVEEKATEKACRETFARIYSSLSATV
ncbi:MAG: O-antigen biosynthesis protein WlbH [Bacteroidales bacterium]